MSRAMPSCSHSRPKRPSPPTADWAALPPDILFTVFLKLEQRDIFRGADSVCTSWRRVAVGEPVLWRHVDMREVSLLRSTRGLAMLTTRMNRSAGQCEAFSAGRCDESSLTYLVQM
ncbi:hypothetical protein HU200_005050 [Digitaria exilis]|uniref:F-box domain-containing protein n=1 Tax=Digitaria exilis TaxID=1010633 RepID=A0A835FTI0_9POAL|nr:hypothetical protein HU200_005050 [Digitaria exilis]